MSEELFLENRCFQELEIQKNFLQQADNEIIVQDIDSAVDALLQDPHVFDNSTKKKIIDYQQEINSSHLGWAKLPVETDLQVLAALLFEWIEGLKLPVLGMKSFEIIVVFYKQTETCFQKLSEVININVID